MEPAGPRTRWQYLERDPKSSLRQLSIKGRRIRARTLYGMFMSAEEPRTVEEIAADYGLPVEAVAEAIEYCQSKPVEIEIDFQISEALMEAHGMNEPRYKGDPKGAFREVGPQARARIVQDVLKRFGAR
jgi:uncharacterized protein (DUF433 family)